MRKFFSFLHDCIELIPGLVVTGGYLACAIYMCKMGIQSIPDMFWYDWEREGHQIAAVLKVVFCSILCFGPLANVFVLNWWWWAEDWFRGKMK